jgi:hypothetical protein
MSALYVLLPPSKFLLCRHTRQLMQYGPYAGVTVSLSSRPGGFRVEHAGQAFRVELG